MGVTQAVEQVRPSIVQIVFRAADFPDNVFRQEVVPLGTGFFVNSEAYIMTASHVVREIDKLTENFGEAEIKRPYVGLAMPQTEIPQVTIRGSFMYEQFDRVDEDAVHDLALLRLKSNPFKDKLGFMKMGDEEIPLPIGVAALNPNRPNDGAAIGISGYPLQQPVLVTNAGHMATAWAFNIQEAPVPGAPKWFRKSEVADTYLADIEVNPGNSGGPVYLVENGSVLGVCIASLSSPIWNQNGQPVNIDGQELYYSSGLTEVVPAKYVIDLMKKHSLSYSELSD